MPGQVEYEFLFVVDGVALDDDATVNVLTDAFDGVLSWNRGLYRLAMSSQGAGALDALRNLLTRVSSEVPGLKILRLDPDLVGISDIAERTGRTRQNVQQWVTGERNSDHPFPSPEGCAGRSLVWRWADVNGWLKPLGFDDQAARPTRDESVFMDAALIAWNDPHGKARVLGDELLAWRASKESPVQARSGGLTHSPAFHQSLIARIPVVTGRNLNDWFRLLESGPAYLRREERAHWLADECGIGQGYAYAIVQEYEIRRRVQPNRIPSSPAEEKSPAPPSRRPY
jgi:predicted DNA-binding transcriptional regulator AlpA